MKFGKLPNISGIDFTLPPDHLYTNSFLGKQQVKKEPKIYIGCTGWTQKEWIGSVYPNGTKAKDYLKYYSKSFETIEFNTTHYRTPTENSVKKWDLDTPAGFRFCPKILQQVSHRNDLALNNDVLSGWLAAIGGLASKIGSCFMQLPPYFGADRQELLIRFLRSFPQETPLAIELRHPSWFNHQQTLTPLMSVLEELKMGLVITDVAGRRDVLHMGLTCSKVLIRFVGNNLVPSDYSRIDQWVERIATWCDQGVEEVYFFPHQPDNIKAPEMAAYLARQLNTKTPYEVLEPNLSGVIDILDSGQGIQGTLF